MADTSSEPGSSASSRSVSSFQFPFRFETNQCRSSHVNDLALCETAADCLCAALFTSVTSSVWWTEDLASVKGTHCLLLQAAKTLDPFELSSYPQQDTVSFVGTKWNHNRNNRVRPSVVKTCNFIWNVFLLGIRVKRLKARWLLYVPSGLTFRNSPLYPQNVRR